MTGLQTHMDTSTWKGNPSINNGMKSVEQGAATTVFAAVDKGLEGTGGKYLLNCEIAKSSAELGEERRRDGSAEWAYDDEAAKRLWKESCSLVRVENDGE